MLLDDLNLAQRKRIIGQSDDYFLHGDEPNDAKTTGTPALIRCIEVEKPGWYIGRTKASISFAKTVER